MPIPKAKKKGRQLPFDTEWTEDRIESNEFINRVRVRIAQWRAGGWRETTPTTRAVLEPWTDQDRGGDLLKKTGAGNLFMVFGEPDLEITRALVDGVDGAGSGEFMQVGLNGADVYDPTTGEVRSGSTDDVACWFLDTNYNGESFFVREVYFTGGNDPYAQLKHALKADIDESAWEELYSTVSREFRPPETGRIAVKVINHYGDEVMQVYEVIAS